MNARITRSFLLLAVVLIPFRTSQAAFDVKSVAVGSPGNAPDLDYGAVPYNYRIGTFDVTNAQYAAFLNAKASSADPFGLWSSRMDPTTNLEGAISRSGLVSYSYTVRLGYSNKPVDYVSWYDA